jgi:predicted RNA-binding Zn-ribbon protein involved in translation (DUF1610 family)
MKLESNPFGIARLTSGLAVALALVASLPGETQAQDQMKGGERALHLLGIKTKADVEVLKPGDTVAMACTKCKSVMIHNVSTEKGHIQVMTVGQKHLCPGCSSTITVVGTGKQAKDEVKHVCEKCGDDSVFCCATKPGSGATKGMEGMEKK